MRPSSFHRLGLACAALCVAAGCATRSSDPYPVPVGQSFRDAPWAPEMVVVPAGRFRMGSSEAETTREGRAAATAATERPAHDVTFAAPFAIGRFDVTVGQFDRFVRATDRASTLAGCMVDDHGSWHVMTDRSYRDPLFDQTNEHPAVCVTWDDARDYAAWLSKETGHRYRLVHEDEWEYTARAGTVTARWWGDDRADLCAHANGADQHFDRAFPGDSRVNTGCDDGYAGTAPVTTYPANPFGLHDMIGNAWQWVDDCYRDHYNDPVPATCNAHVIRGGSWHNAPDSLRSAARFSLASDNRSSSIGFRVARDPDAGSSNASER